MPPRPWIDPELAAILAAIPREALPPGSIDFNDLPTSRERMAAGRAPVPAPESVAVDERRVPGPPGSPEVRLRCYRPKAAASNALPCLYWIHGGGMVIGRVENDDERLGWYVDQLGIAAISVDYRLAPEHPHPAPVEDCYAGLKWLGEHAAALGVDPARIALGGASAGGGLAAGTALIARDRGGPAVALQLLIYPMLDDRNITPASYEVVDVGIWDRETNIGGWRALLGGQAGKDGVSPYAAPARATDVSRLPPAFVDVGTADLFRDEDIEYAQRMMQAGVPVELQVYPGAYHGFDAFAPASRIALNARAARADALVRALGLNP